jgi:DNA-binding MarR family transcriptional regulator
VRDAFTRLIDEISAGIALRYPDVTPAQNEVMVMIDADGSRVTELAKRLGVAKQSTAEAVTGLEARGFVERRPDPSDGRARLIALTPAGWDALGYGYEVVLGIHARWESLLGETKMRRLVALLRELIDKLDAEREEDG